MSERNPVRERIAQIKKAPSNRTAWLIGILSGVVGFSLAVLFPILADSQQNSNFLLVIQIMSGLSLVVTFVLPLVGLALVTIATAGFYNSDDFALLRITTLPPQLIHAGLVDGNAIRLRIMRNIGLMLIPSGFIGMAFDIGATIANINCFPVACRSYYSTFVMSGALPAAVTVVILMFVHFFLWRLSLNVGVWLSLQTGRSAIVYAIGLIFGVILIAVLLIIGAVQVATANIFFALIVGVPIGLGACAVTWLLSYDLGGLLQYESIKLIRRGAIPPA